MAVSGRLPAVVAHADWSLDARKRRVARAVHEGAGSYRALAPMPVGDLRTFLNRLHGDPPRPGPLLLGVDFPIGLPQAYARRVGVTDFRRLLPQLGRGPWRDFFRVAEGPHEVDVMRPFYPLRGGRRGTVARRHLFEGLGLAAQRDLLRVCDLSNGHRPDACAMFWTLGPQQVGKAAIVGWRDFLIPALEAGHNLALWPFEGALERLLAERDFVVAEVYPAEVYGQLDLPAARGKRRQQARAERAPALSAHLRHLGVTAEPSLRDALADGFGAAADGEDCFDAVVGLIGMLNVMLGKRPAGLPGEAIRRIEGWNLGQDVA